MRNFLKHLNMIFLETVEWLLTLHPSSVNATNHDGRSALHLAAASGNMEIVILLCNKKAMINPVMLYKVSYINAFCF